MRTIRFLAALSALLLTFGGVAQTGSTEVRVGLEAVGTFSWVTFAMEHYGIDEQFGLDLSTTTYATKQAKELALREGQVDLVVDDFTGVVLWREQGIPARAVYPYSRATGGIVVPEGSDIEGIEDLRGRRIAVTNLRDKSLLVLRTLAVSEYGFDPQVDSEIIAAAPPLMEELLARNEVDAVIPPWHFVARMVAGGQVREIAMITELLEEMGLSADLPTLVVAARDDLDPNALMAFLGAMDATIERMRHDEEIWDLILKEELYSLPDPTMFPQVVERWEQGLPQAWSPAVIEEIGVLVEQMVDLAGEEVVGVARFNRDAYTAEFNPAHP